MQGILQVSKEVKKALSLGQAVVALESTVIAHGLPFPTNLEAARQMEAIVREHDAVPATIALLEGVARVGLDDDDLEQLATTKGIRKVSCRDLAIVIAQKIDGATTVAATATIAAWAGIDVLATGGIGGVHRNAPFDVSNDLPTLGSVPIAVVCAGVKSILDMPATLEWLETAGVPVVGYGTDDFPAFYRRKSGLPVDVRVDTPHEAASIILAAKLLGLSKGTLIGVPVPKADELPAKTLDAAMTAAFSEAEARGIEGKASTPFLLKTVAQETGGASLRANVSLLENNAAVAAQVAVALTNLIK